MNIALLLDRAAAHSPQRTAVYLGAEPLYSYRQLRERVAALASGLTDLGCRAGDRVGIVMGNRPEYLEVLFASWWAGLVVVPVNAKLHPGEAAWILQDCEARLVVTDQSHLAGLRAVMAADLAGTTLLVAGSAQYAAMTAVPGPVRPCLKARVSDLAWLFYTSGTTGRPKGVMLAHRQLLAMTLSYHAQIDAVGSEDRTLYAAPMSHGAGIYSPVFMLNGSGHVFPASGRFDAAEVCDIAQVLGNVSLFAAPTIVNRLAAHISASRAGLKGTNAFRAIVYGGGPMYVDDLIRAREAMGDRLVQIYGQCESPMTITTLGREVIANDADPRWMARIASVGTAFAACDLAVVDPSGAPMAPGLAGEIVVRGDTVMMGYWRNPQATAATIRDGWLWTGDVGSLDDDGYLTLKDRSKDVIISGGTNIYPREVEEVLLRHGAVREVSVIGRADSQWGESVVACVVVDDASVGAPELDAFCRANMTGFKRPKTYHFLKGLPKNNNGKVLKSDLRATYASRSPEPAVAFEPPLKREDRA
jgi:long-chain acyl-CoA synthetase